MDDEKTQHGPRPYIQSEGYREALAPARTQLPFLAGADSSIHAIGWNCFVAMPSVC